MILPAIPLAFMTLNPIMPAAIKEVYVMDKEPTTIPLSPINAEYA
jgi:hypothetical protein